MQAAMMRPARAAAPFTSGAQRAVPRVARVAAAPRPVVRAQAAAADLGDYSYLSAGASAAPVASEDVKLRIRMRAFDKNLLADAVEQIAIVADATGAGFSGPVMLPTKRKIYCVLRSPHVNKDAREHFEVRTHNRLVDLKNLSADTVTAMMNWVPPSGVEVECSLA